MHARRLAVFVLATALGTLFLAGPIAGAINDRGSADPSGESSVVTAPLVPFVGAAEVGCTRGSGGPVCGGHHSYDAIDFLLPNGTPIISPVDGFVVAVEDGCSNTPFACAGYGNFVHVAAADGTASYVLSHLSEVVVTAGKVVAGQLLGYSGESGRASIPHLHFEEHSYADRELGGERREPSRMVGCVEARGATSYPQVSVYDSWYDIPSHAGVSIVNACSADPILPQATLGGRAEVRNPEVLDLVVDPSVVDHS